MTVVRSVDLCGVAAQTGAAGFACWFAAGEAVNVAAAGFARSWTTKAVVCAAAGTTDTTDVRSADLRAYQLDAIAEVDRVIAGGARRIIVTAPTGSGKTIIAAELIKAARDCGIRVLVLVHRREIIRQTSFKLSAYGIGHGFIAAGLVADPAQAVQLASVQTLWSRGMRRDAMAMPAASLLIVDECHHCPAESYRGIIAEYPNAVLIGLTATPCRSDGGGLGGIFDTLIETPQVAELITQGYLVRTRVYAPTDPDLKGVRTVAGDYVERELADRMDRANLVGDIVTHWHKFGERRKTVAFACSVAHSIHIRDEFLKSGVKAEHVDGSTPKPDRDAALARLASGEIELIANCMVLTEGWDMPEVGCCILARPTRKMGLYRQMVGRVLRPAAGKADAIVLDHSGAVFRHGFVEDRVEWRLDPDKRAISPTHVKRLETRGYSSRLLECSQCSSLRAPGEKCPHCGFLPTRPPKAVAFKDGELAYVDRNRRTATIAHDAGERARWHGMLAWIAAERGYKAGWVGHKFKDRFGAWPPQRQASPIEPSPECLSWVRSRAIAYAKSKKERAA
jgi:superfamily II DNA or RNA helicase